MLRSYLVASSQKTNRRRVHNENKERRHKEILELRLIETETAHRQYQANLLCQIDALQQELNTSGGDNMNLSREVQDLRANLMAAQTLAEEMEQQVQHVQTLHEAKILQLEKDTQEQIARSQEAIDMRKRYEVLKQHLLESEVRSQETTDLRRRHEMLKESFDDMRQSNEKLKERQAETDVRFQETADLRKRYETLKECSEALRQSNEQLKERLIENENFLRTQEGKVAARFEKQLAEARCEVAQARADCDDFEANLEKCQKQLHNAREQNAKLRAYLEEGEDVDKENRDTSNSKSGFISNALGQARRTFQLGHHK